MPWVAADSTCAGRLRRSSGRSSSRRRTSTPTTGRSCCDITTSSSRRTWRATWARASGCASRSTTMMPPRRTKVSTGKALGGHWEDAGTHRELLGGVLMHWAPLPRRTEVGTGQLGTLGSSGKVLGGHWDRLGSTGKVLGHVGRTLEQTGQLLGHSERALGES